MLLQDATMCNRWGDVEEGKKLGSRLRRARGAEEGRTCGGEDAATAAAGTAALRSATLGLFRGYVAGMTDIIEIHSCGRELGDLASTAGGQRDLEDLGADHFAHGAFVHLQESATGSPVPAFVA